MIREVHAMILHSCVVVQSIYIPCSRLNLPIFSFIYAHMPISRKHGALIMYLCELKNHPALCMMSPSNGMYNPLYVWVFGLYRIPMYFPFCFMNTHHVLVCKVDTTIPNCRIHHLTPVLGFNCSAGLCPEVCQLVCHLFPKSSDVVKEDYHSLV